MLTYLSFSRTSIYLLPHHQSVRPRIGVKNPPRDSSTPPIPIPCAAALLLSFFLYCNENILRKEGILPRVSRSCHRHPSRLSHRRRKETSPWTPWFFFLFVFKCVLASHCTILHVKQVFCRRGERTGVTLGWRGRFWRGPVAGVTCSKSRGQLQPPTLSCLGPAIGRRLIPVACDRALCGDADRHEMALGDSGLLPPPRRWGESESPYIRDMSGSMF